MEAIPYEVFRLLIDTLEEVDRNNLEKVDEFDDYFEQYWKDKTWKDFGIKNGDKILYETITKYSNLERALEFLVERRDFVRALKLTNAGVSSDKALKDSCLFGSTEVVEDILKNKKINPSINGQYCLTMASSLGYVDIVKLLLRDPRVKPEINDSIAIGLAAKMDRLEVVKLLTEDGRSNVKIALKNAKERNRLEIVRFLEEL